MLLHHSKDKLEGYDIAILAQPTLGLQTPGVLVYLVCWFVVKFLHENHKINPSASYVPDFLACKCCPEYKDNYLVTNETDNRPGLR